MMEGVMGAVSSSLTMVLGFLLVLTVVVFFHELGHFLVARWCGVTVKTFSIGFGKELWGFYDRHGTRWRVAAIPLGGYVKFVDDANAASAPSREALDTMSAKDRAGAFQLKPVWQRSAVVAAGPIANFILAAVIYTAVYMAFGVRTTLPVIDVVVPDMPAAKAGLMPGDRVLAIDGWEVESFDDIIRTIATGGGRTAEFRVSRNGRVLDIPVSPDVKEHSDELGVTVRLGDIGIRRLQPAQVGEVLPDLPAAKAGLKTGDRVIAIDGRPIDSFDDLVEVVAASANKALHFVVERGDRRVEAEVTPILWEQKDPAGKLVKRGRIGVAPARPAPVAVNPIEAVRLGLRETWANIVQTLSGLRDIVTRRQSADQMGGPILMAEVTARALELGLEPLLGWTALISVSIGLLNLMPIPVLDGGHLLFYAIEAIRRKPLSQRMQDIGLQIGLALVLMLVVYVNLNDIIRVGKRWLLGGG